MKDQFGGDAERIGERLLSSGALARFDTRERAQALGALLQDAGLEVDVALEGEEFAWGSDAKSARPSAQPVAQQSSPPKGKEAPTSSKGRAALVGAALCLVLGGLVAYYSPPFLVVFGPLFLAAFVLSIVGIAQGSTIGGILLLVVTLIVGPLMSITGVARMLFPAFVEAPASPATPTTPPIQASQAPQPQSDTSAQDGHADQPLVEPHDAEADYSRFIEIYEFEATRINTILDSNVAAIRFKARNTGERTVSRLRVTAYFRDSNDRVIFEDSFTVVSSLAFGSDTLRVMHPGYIFQMPAGRYLTSPRVPDEWQVGNAILQVTTVELD